MKVTQTRDAEKVDMRPKINMTEKVIRHMLRRNELVVWPMVRQQYNVPPLSLIELCR